MKILIGKHPVSSIAGYLMAAILMAQQIFSSGHKEWYVILIAGLLAAAGRFANDCIVLGDNPKTSIAGLLQLIILTALQEFKNGPIDWWLIGASVSMAVLARLSGDSKGDNSPLSKLTRQ